MNKPNLAKVVTFSLSTDQVLSVQADALFRMAPQMVVMIGDVGMGKSTIVEKITGSIGLSSSADESFTTASVLCETWCKRLQLIDTPGANPMQEKLKHNVWIAHAMNYMPVSLLLIVVKADTRIDNTIGMVRNYAERLMNMSDILGVCVTHMDMVTWTQQRFLRCLNDELGFDRAVFTGTTTLGPVLVDDILGCCQTPMDLNINSANFLEYFNISNNNLKILRSVNKEVADFRIMKEMFYAYLPTQNQQDQVDLVFEFQAWMTDQIYKAQRRVSEHNSFTFIGDPAKVANESGHLANLTNQLRAVLFDVRTMALAYQNNAGISTLRKCPWCGEIWAKLEGCDDGTTCGNRMTERESRFNTLGSFMFIFDGKDLKITKVGTKALLSPSVNSRIHGRGCGKPIDWKQMAPVAVPEEFHVTKTVSTGDIDLIPAGAKRPWVDTYSRMASSLGPLKRIRTKLTPGFP